MKKAKFDFDTVREQHLAGDFANAEAGYLSILRENPRDAASLHFLGILYAQQENFPDAIHYLEKAQQQEPNNPIMQLHLSNILKIQGQYGQAAQLLQKTVADHPEYVPGLNNLGTVYYAQSRYNDAVKLYQRALQLKPDYPDAYYNLGLAYDKLNQVLEATDAFQKLLDIAPEHLAARFHLACLLMKQNKIDAAIQQFVIIEQARPNHLETQSNLATCYLKKGALNEAKIHYIKALELAKDDTQILFNLGVILSQQDNLDGAIQYYQRLLRIKPDDFATHNNLGVAFLAKQHASFALHHFKEALRLQPNNESIRYIISMLSQNQRLLAAPPDYVKSLFDAYADHYEPHLLQALSYQVPTLLLKAIKKVVTPKDQAWAILDLGCGTGLCGVEFKPYAKTLDGVDLSDKMLEFAAQKNIYDALTTADLTEFLKNKLATYDVILAGDVFVYIGELDDIFHHARLALNENGLFAFNAEIVENISYRMNQSGRFAHQKQYLDSLATKHGFAVAHYQQAMTRIQNTDPVYGHVYVLRAQ